MKNKLIGDRVKWGSVVVMGLAFSLYTSENNWIEKRAIPHKAGESKDEASQFIRLDSPCTSSFLMFYSY